MTPPRTASPTIMPARAQIRRIGTPASSPSMASRRTHGTTLAKPPASTTSVSPAMSCALYGRKYGLSLRRAFMAHGLPLNYPWMAPPRGSVELATPQRRHNDDEIYSQADDPARALVRARVRSLQQRC